MRRDFIANAAHELRTPLTNLQGYLEALRDGVITADRATYESLHEEADRLVRLSRSLDALAEGDAAVGAARGDRDRPRGGRPDRRSTSRSPSLERAGLDGRARGPGPRCRRGPNPDHLAQVLANLLSNAARYTPAGGTVTVRAERRPGRPPRLGRQHRRRDPAGRPRARVRALLPRREVARPGARRRRDRPGDRQAARRGGRRPGRRRVAATARPGSGSASRPDAVTGSPIAIIPTATPTSPTHWIGLSRSPRNATATRIVTAGPNDAARPTIQVGADLEADRERDEARARRARRPPRSRRRSAALDQAGPSTGRRPRPLAVRAQHDEHRRSTSLH